MGQFLRRAQGRDTAASPRASASLPGEPGSPDVMRSPQVTGSARATQPSVKVNVGRFDGRRIAFFGTVAVLGLALHTGNPAQSLPLFGHRTGTAHATLTVDSGLAAAANPDAGAMVAPVSDQRKPSMTPTSGLSE